MPASWPGLVLSLSASLFGPIQTYGAEGLRAAVWGREASGITDLVGQVISRATTAPTPLPMLLGNGLAYYLGVVASQQGPSDLCLKFWEHSVRYDPMPWSEEAYRAGLEYLLKKKSWDRLLDWAELRLSMSPTDPLAPWYRVWALYELDRWEEAEANLPHRFPTTGFGAERPLVEVVGLLIQLNGQRQSVAPQLRAIVWGREAGEVHIKIHRHLDRLGLWDLLDGTTRALLRARSESASGRNAQAFEAIQGVLRSAELYTVAGVWSDLVRIHIRAGKGRDGNALLTPRASRLTGPLGVAAWSALGRLRAAIGLAAQARDAFLTAARLSPSIEATDPFYQQAASNAFQIGFREGLAVLERAPWRRPDLYSAMVQRQIAEAIQRQDFPSILELYSRLRSRLSATDRLGLEWTLVRLHRHGLVRWNAAKLGHSPDKMLQAIANFGGTSYPVLMARYTLGLPLVDIPAEGRWPRATASADVLVRGFLELGLSDLAFQRFVTSGEALDWDFAAKLLHALVEQRHYLPSIRLVTRLSARNEFRAGHAEWKVLYPLAFWDEIRSVATQENIDPLLFLSLVREESLFDPRIHSPVGATGLSQLMPATFREQSRRMGLIDPDIYDPFTNLSIGGNYLAMRLRGLGHPSKALMAYNAGAHRVGTWNRFLDRLPDELMTEAIPFHETRNYVKKILRSRLIYSVLYGMGTVDEAVQSIYPRFRK